MDRRAFSKLGRSSVVAAAIAAAATSAQPAPAHACGGLFCSSANPVNQAAEQIIFSENGDGTVTAVIQILYQGPAHKFAWVLPVAGNPEVAVSSNTVFDALKAQTNPTYQLQTVFDDCGGRGGFGNVGAPSAPVAMGPMATPGVMQVASGAVGPYLYDVISVDSNLPAPEDAAINWLDQNEYDVGELGPEVLRPYLEEGLNLIAFKLQKGNDSGSIRPVMLTYESKLPAIPIRPTAVAANDDMGVMVWILSASRAIPANYKALELNEALINWFNPMSNYNEVVSRAADEAMGQGFVTEFAGKMQDLVSRGFDVFPASQQQVWTEFSSREHVDALSMLQEAQNNWSAWDGYADALQAAVTLPDNIAYEDFQQCARCYINAPGVVFDTQVFLTQLYEKVIKPVLETKKLLASRPYITRLYTTLSAEEMTTDPIFDFNPDLGDVSNIHTATRRMACNGNDWRVDFGQAGTVTGSGFGSWPVAVESQPAAMRILEYGTRGEGRVLEDRTREIVALNKPPALPMAGSGAAGSGTSGLGTAGRGAAMIPPPGADPAPTDGGVPNRNDSKAASKGDGCSAAGGGAGSSLAWLLFASAALLRRRRARAGQ